MDYQINHNGNTHDDLTINPKINKVAKKVMSCKLVKNDKLTAYLIQHRQC